MRFSSIVVLTTTLSLSALCAGIPAQSAPVSHPPAQPPVQNSAAATYDNLRAVLRPLAVSTANDVLSRVDALSGHAVEIRGTVCGLLSGARGRTCLLQMPDAILPLNAPAEIDSPALHPNAQVRLLVLVNADSSNSPLTILAVSDSPSPAGTLPATIAPAPGDTPLMGNAGANIIPQGGMVTAPSRVRPGGDNLVLMGNGAGSGDDLVVVPPMTETALPTPDAHPDSPVQSAAPLQSQNWDVDTQVPAYKSLILRHNPRLRDDQAEEIAAALVRHGYAHRIDPRFLAAVVCVESGFNPYAVSRSGAMGLGQLMPFNLHRLGVQNAWSPDENIGGCALMLRHLLDQFGNRPNATLLAVAAYNAGPNAVVRAGYRVPSGSQVQGYVWKIYYRYRAYAPEMFR